LKFILSGAKDQWSGRDERASCAVRAAAPLILRAASRRPAQDKLQKMTLESIELQLRDYAMSFPEATEDFPWGHRAIKVKKKAFLFLGGDKSAPELSLSVKLPSSRDIALDLPFAEPTGYGLGKSGWVSARFSKAKDVPLDLLKAWIDESYRAIAPKKLSAQLAR
jgi:predicted DNA-binding protein (MmcQ/YjbR family)